MTVAGIVQWCTVPKKRHADERACACVRASDEKVIDAKKSINGIQSLLFFATYWFCSYPISIPIPEKLIFTYALLLLLFFI